MGIKGELKAYIGSYFSRSRGYDLRELSNCLIDHHKSGMFFFTCKCYRRIIIFAFIHFLVCMSNSHKVNIYLCSNDAAMLALQFFRNYISDLLKHMSFNKVPHSPHSHSKCEDDGKVKRHSLK